jgi:hypothetical protein
MTKQPPRNIKIVTRACDGSSRTRRFKTLGGARKFAQAYVGQRPTFGSDYAVSDDGIGTVRVFGDATLREIFPEGM